MSTDLVDQDAEPPAPVCDPPGYHVFIEGELCQCGDRKRVLPAAPQLVTDSNVVGCARCGGDHLIRFKEFKRGPMMLGEESLTHWGLCPVTKEPVLMRFVEAE